MRSYMSANQLAFLCIFCANRNDSSDTYCITQFCQCYMKLDVTPMGREMLLIPNGLCNDNAKATNEIRHKVIRTEPEFCLNNFIPHIIISTNYY
jgi:hypothetical protein